MTHKTIICLENSSWVTVHRNFPPLVAPVHICVQESPARKTWRDIFLVFCHLYFFGFWWWGLKTNQKGSDHPLLCTSLPMRKNYVGKYISGCYCYCCFRLEFLAPSLEITMSMEITVVGNQSINVKVFVLNVQCFFGVSMLWLCATCQDCVKQNIGILKVAWV